MLLTPDSWLPATVAQSGMVAGATTRRGGHSGGAYAANNLALHVGDDATAVAANRKALQAALGASHIQWLDQVHGRRCIYASRLTVDEAPVADAMWTDCTELALAIMTADCVPVLLWARDGSVAGAAHAGWRGLRDGVIDELVASLPVAPRQLQAWIGPCISQQHYEVGVEVWSQFAQKDVPGVLADCNQQDKRLLNLNLLAEYQLTQLGVCAVEQCGVCTYANGKYYSHRRDPGTGRMASLIMLRAEA